MALTWVLAQREATMDLGLVGKTAIVTGGSAGIGRACAAALHALVVQRGGGHRRQDGCGR